MSAMNHRIHFSLKRAFDILFSTIALVLLSPLIGVIAMVIYCRMGGPIFYRQPRPGYQRCPFIINKFRTMNDGRDKDGNLAPDEMRLTALGRILRNTSLDEIPEFYNVLKGDMSLVGPRPLLTKYLDRYTAEQARRHEVKPGFTGWAQVNGRNTLTWEEKFEKDLWYVDHQSFGLDIKIMALTVVKILNREGINSPGHLTAEEFKGTQKNGK